jgi:methylmalonyl-CoA mutase
LPRSQRPPRILTAVPLCDGHDSAITTINLELVQNGWEVVYLGYHQAASAIARAAAQEDVSAIGLSSYNGGHVVFFREVMAELRARGAADVALYGGGGGTITKSDERAMRKAGVRRIFFPGTTLGEMMEALSRGVPGKKPSKAPRGDRALGRAITLAEGGTRERERPPRQGKPTGRRMATVGVAGPGGAGKSTLIDELVSRYLTNNPAGRVAVLANDPSHPRGGALLGDRVSAIYSDSDRVFFRSLATRGSTSGISSAVPGALEILDRSGQFDLVFVESVGIGQESDPFGVFSPRRLVDTVLFVLPPHYGSRIQLQKIPLLVGADLVVLNKCDDPKSASARREIAVRLSETKLAPPLLTTVASRHDDTGVDGLYRAIVEKNAARRRLESK